MAQLNISRQPDYTDLDLDFKNNPITGDINKKKGNYAVKRSIRNLIFTNYYERPFKMEIGSGVPRLLFDNVDVITASSIKDAIKILINTYERRVQLLDVSVYADIDNNGFNVQLSYIILNTETPASFNLFLEKIR